MRDIKLLKNNEGLDLSDKEWADKLYAFLQKDIKLTQKKAFSIIYFLQEHMPVIPDKIEKCDICGDLYDSYCEGYHSELTNKFYCSEGCEPRGLYEREQRAEARKNKKS